MNKVLFSIEPEVDHNELLFSSALWVRMLCFAFLDLPKEAEEDICLLTSNYANEQRDCDQFCIRQVADFADPNERLSPQQCQERVHSTALAMRALALKIPNKSLMGTVNLCISELENAALNCCQLEHWTKCLEPIIDAWQYLKNSMDKGVSIAPRILFPMR